MKIRYHARLWTIVLVITILIAGFVSIANIANSISLNIGGGQKPLSNGSVQRVVMIESFTNTDCGPCANANPVMNDLVDEYGPTQVSIIRYHVWWPDENDPFYQANIKENTDRTNYYDVNAVPDCFFDGVIHDGNRREYRNHIGERLEVPSPLTIKVTGSLGETEGTITANITAVDEITQTELKAHYVVTEDNIPYNAPNGETNHRFVMRDMIPDAWGNNITISKGESIEMTKTFTIGGDWNRSNLWAIVFVQSNSTKEILQSGNHFYKGIWPDLFISSSDITFSDSTPNEGDTITITATVHNVGNENASNVVVRFYDGRPNTIGSSQIGADQTITNILANGGTGDASVQWDTTGERGEHSIYVRADATFDISEPNEKNNTASKYIHVAPPDDVGVDSVEPFVEGETYPMDNYTITANVKNYGANSQSPFNVTCEIRKFGALEQRTIFSDDFDGPDKGWIEDPSTSCWERGEPTSGPGSAHSPPNCWATNLAGNYPGGADDWLISSIIELPSRVTSVNLTFWHWYSLDATGYYDYGYVRITSSNGLYWAKLKTYTGSQTSWQRVNINISSYIGKEIRVAFQIYDQGVFVSTGWYIDDFEIVGTLPNETTVYGPNTKSTVGTMYQDDVQQITWNYEFTSEGDYKLITNTSLSGDQYINNDWKNVTFTIFEGDISVEPPTNIWAELTGADYENVTITWSKSADDGGGENDITGYEIYYNQTYSKDKIGYTLLASLGAGNTSYVHKNDGLNTTNSFYYIVAKDDNDNTAATDDQAGKFVREMPYNESTPRQLVSIPLVQSDTAITKVLQTIEGNYSYVQWYNATDTTDHWRTYSTNKPSGFNDLLNVDHKMALWITMTSHDNLTIAGRVPKNTTIQLYEGWNFVSYASFINRTVEDALGGISYEKVEGFNESDPPYYLKILKDIDIMTAGDGYWIRVTSDCTWTVEN